MVMYLSNLRFPIYTDDSNKLVKGSNINGVIILPGYSDIKDIKFNGLKTYYPPFVIEFNRCYWNSK